MSPSRGRSPSTEPVKISRPPGRITLAAARAPRNAPVRLTSRIVRHAEGLVWRGPAMIGEIPALQIHTSTPPHSATTPSATASLNSSSVTSPANTSDDPGSSSATALRSVSVRATSATDAPPCENACASNRPRPRPRARDHHALAGHVRATREGVRNLHRLRHDSRFVPISTILALKVRVPVDSRAGARRERSCSVFSSWQCPHFGSMFANDVTPPFAHGST